MFGKDFWAYGVEPNRPTWAAIGRYVHEQGLAPRVVGADELFAPGVNEPQQRTYFVGVACLRSSWRKRGPRREARSKRLKRPGRPAGAGTHG